MESGYRFYSQKRECRKEVLFIHEEGADCSPFKCAKDSQNLVVQYNTCARSAATEGEEGLVIVIAA